jgi:hypothetical protein
VFAANQSLDLVDTIKFDPTIFSVPRTINLSTGEIAILETTQVIIDGGDANGNPLNITINAGDTNRNTYGDTSRIFYIPNPVVGAPAQLVTLKHLTLTGADTPLNNFSGSGGAIYSRARLAVYDCIIENNTSYFGGAILVRATSATVTGEVLHIENSVIRNNQANDGGGVAIQTDQNTVEDFNTYNILGSTITGNQTIAHITGNGQGQGGGLYANIAGSVDPNGAAQRTLSIINCAFGDYGTTNGLSNSNTAGQGGAMYIETRSVASLLISGATITNNVATKIGVPPDVPPDVGYPRNVLGGGGIAIYSNVGAGGGTLRRAEFSLALAA